MTAQQTALGDSTTPASTAPDTVPAGCYWWTDPDGDLCLLPGCMARVQDPDAECTRVQRQLREAQERQRYADQWYAALAEALDAHPAGREIRADAQRRRAAA